VATEQEQVTSVLKDGVPFWHEMDAPSRQIAIDLFMVRQKYCPGPEICTTADLIRIKDGPTELWVRISKTTASIHLLPICPPRWAHVLPRCMIQVLTTQKFVEAIEALRRHLQSESPTSPSTSTSMDDDNKDIGTQSSDTETIPSQNEQSNKMDIDDDDSVKISEDHRPVWKW
jgi:hypothetical protein